MIYIITSNTSIIKINNELQYYLPRIRLFKIDYPNRKKVTNLSTTGY